MEAKKVSVDAVVGPSSPSSDCDFRFDGVMGFDEIPIPDSEFSHKHAQMATYKGEPIVVGSCWGLEVEQLITSELDLSWNQLESFPNPVMVSFFFTEQFYSHI